MARYYNNSSYYDYYLQYISLPIRLFFCLAVLFLFLGLTWYINHEPMFEDFMDQLKLILMVSPVVLLLVIRWLSSDDPNRVPFVVLLPGKDSIYRAGGSPWGVGILLVFLLVMISYQTSILERWFPFQSRR